MVSHIFNLVLFAVGYVNSAAIYQDYTGLPDHATRAYAHGTGFTPDRYYAYERTPKFYGLNRADSQRYYADDSADVDHYHGDLLRKSIHEAENAVLKSVSGKAGHHDFSVGSAANQDLAEHSSGRAVQRVAEAGSGKMQEHGAAGSQGYDGFGSTSFKKGHSNTGFHKSYKKKESGKDSKFVDEEHKVGGEAIHKSLGNKFVQAGQAVSGEAMKEGVYEAAVSGGKARSGVKSTGKHVVDFGEHGHVGTYRNSDSAIGVDEAGKYLDRHMNTGLSLDRADVYDSPMYY